MNPNAMLALDLEKITAAIASGTRPNQVLWQTEDSIAFVARGREGRSEFHVDPSDEVMYMIKGDMNLHYRTLEFSKPLSTRMAWISGSEKPRRRIIGTTLAKM